MSQMRLATWFLLLASTLTVMASAPLAPALPGMTAAFTGVSEAAFWTKMTLALPGLVIAICAPLVGSWVDRLPAYLLLRSGLVVFIISAALGYYWQFSLLLVLRWLLAGITKCDYGTPCNHHPTICKHAVIFIGSVHKHIIDKRVLGSILRLYRRCF